MDGDIEIVVQGLRPGEKMYEELFISDSHGTTPIQKVFTADETWIKWSELSKKLDALSFLDSPADRPALRSKLLALAFHGQPSASPDATLTLVDTTSPAEVVGVADSTESFLPATSSS